MWLYQRSDLRAADLLVATSDQELQDIRRLELKNPVAVIPNGVPLISVAKTERPKGVRTMFFLSRIHPKKGLIELVDAWRMARPSGWRLMIGGPDEGGHRSVVEKAVKRAGLTNEISFVGPLDDSVKYHYYGSADAFILPTHSENFGVVIAEALGCGLPVITTRGAPWDVLLTERCGWWVENRIDSLAGAISQACGMSEAELRIMGERGRLFVQRSYSWDAVAQRMIAAYTWLLRGAAKPACVHTL
jgi:glycosyltransferase involved in cell wall biosynthesis